MPRPKLKRIHVNQHVIRRNAKTGEVAPPVRIKTGGQNFAADQVDIQGPSTLVYRPEKPLSCGARVWIETRSPVVVEDAGKQRLLD